MKCFRAAAMFICTRAVDAVALVLVLELLAMLAMLLLEEAAAVRPVLTTIIMYVLEVNASTKAVKCELRTSMPWNWDCVLAQLSLNCFIIFDMRSKRWLS